MRTKFKFFEDPCHGWLQVTQKEAQELNILDKITPYSYIRKDKIFLEEDSDASLFINAYKQKYNKEPNFKMLHTNKLSKIRSYNHFVNSLIK